MNDNGTNECTVHQCFGKLLVQKLYFLFHFILFSRVFLLGASNFNNYIIKTQIFECWVSTATHSKLGMFHILISRNIDVGLSMLVYQCDFFSIQISEFYDMPKFSIYVLEFFGIPKL